MNESEQPDIRARVEAFLDQARSDNALVERLRQDPSETLRAAGFDGEDIETLSQELGGSEVQGFMKCTWTCDRYSCMVTMCGNIPFSN